MFNHVGNYICICGKTFTNSQSFNGHKAHCKQHQISKYKTLDYYNDHIEKCISARSKGHDSYINKQKLAKSDQLKIWLSEQHTCEHCGKAMTEKYGSGRFCCRACANSRKHSEETKQKIGLSVKKFYLLKPKKLSIHIKNNKFIKPKYKCKINKVNIHIMEYNKNPNKCKICDKPLDYKRRFNKTCGSEVCYVEWQREVHKQFTPKARSKNEILFCNLCEDYFGKDDVLHNVKLFDGWDADIIIDKYKIAILWNGIWHYKKIAPNQRFEQIQNRDKLKLKAILKYNYVPYIIQDLGQYDVEKVNIEFEKLINFINTKDKL